MADVSSSISTPGLTPTTFCSTTYGTASSPISFDLVAIGVSGGELITAPPGFEVSNTPGGAGTYGATTTAPGSGTTTIYVRLKATDHVAGSQYSGNVSVSGTGVSTLLVAIDPSTVSKAPLTVSVAANNRHKNYGSVLIGDGSGYTQFTTSNLQNGDVITSI